MPARGLANRVRAVRKLARPASSPVCQELAARGADRLSATMKRGTGLNQGREVLARAAVERRKASASPTRGARRDETHAGGNACLRARGHYPAPFGAPPPLSLFGRPFVRCLTKLGRRQNAPRERDCFFTSPRVRGEVERAERARVRGPLRNSERRGSSGCVTDSHATLSPAERPPHPDLLLRLRAHALRRTRTRRSSPSERRRAARRGEGAERAARTIFLAPCVAAKRRRRANGNVCVIARMTNPVNRLDFITL